MRIGSFIIIILALAGVFYSPAQADIIWSGEKEVNLEWAPSPPPTWPPPPIPISFQLDVNEDGSSDFFLGDADTSKFIVACYGNNTVANGSFSLLPGIPLDANVSWSGGEYILDQWYVLYGQEIGGAGNWHGITGYMGLQFEAADGFHYGWVNMTVYDEFPGMTIHSWAYESTPGGGIITGAVPEPSSVVLAILGALTAWNLRRCRQRRMNTDEESPDT